MIQIMKVGESWLIEPLLSAEECVPNQTGLPQQIWQSLYARQLLSSVVYVSAIHWIPILS
jgi:hypothetical protein